MIVAKINLVQSTTACLACDVMGPQHCRGLVRFENLFLGLFFGGSGRADALLRVCMGVGTKGGSGLE